MRRGLTFHFEQSWTCDNYSNTLRTRHSDIKPVQTIKKFHAYRCVFGARGCQPMDDRLLLLSNYTKVGQATQRRLSSERRTP